MDGELLRWLYHRLLHDPNLSHTRDHTYSDGLILFILFFACLSNRSVRWAAERRNWPVCYRRLVLPSYSQLIRRSKSPMIGLWVEKITDELRQNLPASNTKLCDGKPLIVSGFSKDQDATPGHVPGGWAKGYKVHLLMDCTGRIEQFEVTGLSAGESTVMRLMVQKVDLEGCLVRADANYDSNPLYGAVAQQKGRLIAPRRKPGRGLSRRRHHPHRLVAIKELESSQYDRQRHSAIRGEIERRIGHLTARPTDLFALPNFVRRLPRVKKWISLKVLLNQAHLVLKNRRHLLVAVA